MTLWPTWVERYDCTTPQTPLISAIAIIAATSPASRRKSTVTYLLLPIPTGVNACEKTACWRNAGITPRAETKMIRTLTTDSFAQ